MKFIKTILFTLLLALAVPIIANASESLTISEKSYNENTLEFVITGASTFDEVMVSLFDGEELLSFKTVSADNNSYTATFNIVFNEDKTITIKVGDINSTAYEMTTLNVKKSVISNNNKIVDEGGNSLEYVDATKSFANGNTLGIDVITDVSSLSKEDRERIETIQERLGDKKKIIGIMIVSVLNGDHQVETPELKDGYKLFLNLSENDLKDFTKPYMARLLDDKTLELEDGKLLSYDSTAKGVVVTLNNTGGYILYDDTTVYYNFLDNSENPEYVLDENGEVVLKIDAPFAKLLEVYVDGKLVSKDNYKATEGSTIITFNKSFLETLSTGTHNVRVTFEEGEALTTLTIKETTTVEAISNNTKNPITFDKIVIYIVLCGISAVGIVTTYRYYQTRYKRYE